MEKQPVLSLCIPTNGAVQWVLPTLESIYSQGVDPEDFEVLVVDNGENSLLEGALSRLDYPNLRYAKTNDKGFLNLITSLKMGRGEYHKMINHRCLMTEGSIASMIATVVRQRDSRPILYFADGKAPVEKEELFPNLDAFVRCLAVFCSWSAGVGVWHEDASLLDSIRFDEMFPNASMLFELRQESEYVINNEIYMQMQDESGKGGYDLFYTFGVGFLDLLSDLRHRGRIGIDTFLSVKGKLFDFLCELYYREVVLPTDRTFIIQNVRQSMQIYFGNFGYRRMLLRAYAGFPSRAVLNRIKKFFVRSR